MKAPAVRGNANVGSARSGVISQRVSRKSPKWWAGLAALCVGFASACGPARPNVIVVTIDTLRADRMGLYGHRRDTSPNVDRFAQDAIVFDNAITPQTMTTPALASMWTGLHPHQHGVLRNLFLLPDAYETLAERLAAESYDTAAFVSNYVLIRELSNLQQGFVHYDDELDQKRLAGGERRAGPAIDRVLEWLDSRSDAPFLMWVHLMDPHGPYTPPPPFDTRFARRGGKPRIIPRKQIPLYQFLGSRDRRFYVDRYDGEIAYMDQEFGRLIAGLRERGLYDDALILFNADHGEHLGEHGAYFSHGSHAYEGALRVPLILKLPREHERAPDSLPPRDATLVSLLDVAPTILDVLGLPVPEDYVGRSLLATLSDPRDREIPFRATKVRGLRTRNHVLIQNLRGARVTSQEYYDLSVNPAQRKTSPPDPRSARLAEALNALRYREMVQRPPHPVERHDRTDLDELLRARTVDGGASPHEALEALGYVE